MAAKKMMPSGLPGPRKGTSIDPACSTVLDESDAPGGSVDHDGKSYYFCSCDCREIFEADPDKAIRQQTS